MVTSNCKIEFKLRDIKLKDVPKFYESLISNKISVGVHKREGGKVGSGDLPHKANILEKAYWNEFGTTHVVKKSFKKKSRTDGKWVKFRQGMEINIPPRPFVRLYLYPHIIQTLSREYCNSIDSALKQGLKNPQMLALNILNDVAYKAEKEMYKIINDNSLLKPNAALTVYLKGFDYPLYETGELLNAIKGKVEKRNG